MFYKTSVFINSRYSTYYASYVKNNTPTRVLDTSSCLTCGFHYSILITGKKLANIQHNQQNLNTQLTILITD